MGSLTIRKLREEKGMTIADLATKTNISQTLLKKIESGEKRSPGISVIKDLAKGLSVDYIDLFIAYGYLEEKDLINRALATYTTEALQRELNRRSKKTH